MTNTIKTHRPWVKGKELDRWGELLGVERKRFWFFFKERDKKYRKRLLNAISEVNENIDRETKRTMYEEATKWINEQ